GKRFRRGVDDDAIRSLDTIAASVIDDVARYDCAKTLEAPGVISGCVKNGSGVGDVGRTRLFVQERVACTDKIRDRLGIDRAHGEVFKVVGDEAALGRRWVGVQASDLV